MAPETDVFVIGGGPAGLAVGIAARQKGLRAIVADHALPPIDKACGEGLMPDSITALARLGVRIDAAPGFPFRGIRFLGSGVSVDADFPSGAGLGMRRRALHNLLVDRAVKAGVTLLWGARGIEMSAEGIAVDGQRVNARFLVGADGQNSRVRSAAALGDVRRESRRYGFRRHYRVRPWSDYMELYWGDRFQIYVTPIAPCEVCIALISRNPHLRLDEALEHFPELNSRVQSAEPSSTEMGSLSVSRSLKAVQRGSIALSGDASGSVDAITGEGLCLSFRQALALADAMDRNNLEEYQERHREIAKRPAMMASLMLLIENRPGLRRRVLHGLARQPALFSQLVAFHVGSSSFLDFRLADVLRASRELLTA